MVQFLPSRGVCAAVKKENNAVKKENNAMDTTKVLTVCASLFAISASGETFHWKDNAQSTSWTNKENYVENAA